MVEREIIGMGGMSLLAGCMIIIWAMSTDYLETMHDTARLQSIHADVVTESELFKQDVMINAIGANHDRR